MLFFKHTKVNRLIKAAKTIQEHCKQQVKCKTCVLFDKECGICKLRSCDPLYWII